MSAQGARPSVATGPNTFEITDDRVFGPGGGALARRFARRVLAFDEVRSLALDPALNLERVARLGPGIASTPLSGFIDWRQADLRIRSVYASQNAVL